MTAKKTSANKLRRYLIAKFALGCLFVGTLLTTGVLVYWLFTDGITVGRLALLVVLMLISYIDGAFTGMVCRKIETIKEKEIIC